MNHDIENLSIDPDDAEKNINAFLTDIVEAINLYTKNHNLSIDEKILALTYLCNMLSKSIQKKLETMAIK